MGTLSKLLRIFYNPKSNVNVNLHGIYGEAIDEEFKRLYKAMKPKTKL